MNINIYIEDRLGKQLNQCAKEVGKSRNTLVREALKEWLNHHAIKHWPSSVLNYKGHKKMPAFESTHHELMPPKKDPLV